MSRVERIVAVDPGSYAHGLVVVRITGPGDGDNEVEYAKKDAHWSDVQREVRNLETDLRAGRAIVCCERVAPGQSSWSLTYTTEFGGRVAELHDTLTNGHRHALPLYLMPRREVLTLLRVSGAGAKRDSMVRHTLIEMHGGDRKSAIGTKHKRGPLYGVSSHAWAALAVAVAVRIKRREAHQQHSEQPV